MSSSRARGLSGSLSCLCVVGTINVSGVSPTVNPTFPNSGPQSQMVATVRSSVNNNTGAVVVSSTLQGDANRLLLLDSGEDTGTELNVGIIIIIIIREKQSTIVASQDQAMSTNYFKKKILKEEIDSKCWLCKQHEETIDHLTSRCPI